MAKKRKKRLPTIRNPIAAEVAHNPLFRTRSELSDEQANAKADPWDRRAKHKTTADDQIDEVS